MTPHPSGPLIAGNIPKGDGKLRIGSLSCLSRGIIGDLELVPRVPAELISPDLTTGERMGISGNAAGNGKTGIWDLWHGRSRSVMSVGDTDPNKTVPVSLFRI